MRKIFIIAGIPGSGKSTLAKKIYNKKKSDSVIINNDRIRQMITGTDDATVNDTYRYSNAAEITPIMWSLKIAMIESLLHSDNIQNVILDACHFKASEHDYYEYLSKKFNVQIIHIKLILDKKIALERAQNRIRKEDKKTINFVDTKLQELGRAYDYILANDSEIERFISEL